LPAAGRDVYQAIIFIKNKSVFSQPLYFDTFAADWSPMLFIGVKRETRCKSGAIPVAVKSPHLCRQAEGLGSSLNFDATFKKGKAV
jgi:hypothetical protein